MRFKKKKNLQGTKIKSKANMTRRLYHKYPMIIIRHFYDRILKTVQVYIINLVNQVPALKLKKIGYMLKLGIKIVAYLSVLISSYCLGKNFMKVLNAQRMATHIYGNCWLSSLQTKWCISQHLSSSKFGKV